MIDFSAFADELVKIAISESDLASGAGRIGAKPIPYTELKQFQALTSPTKAQTKRIQQLGTPQYQAALVPKEVMAPAARMMKEHPGQIFVEPSAGKALSPAATGRTEKQLRHMATLHEALERGVKPREIQYSSLHLSPKVVAQELNMINKASPELEDAAGRLRKLREVGGEHSLLRKQLRDTFGDRAAEFTQPGRKIPKAMLRRLLAKSHPDLGVAQVTGMMKGQKKHLLGETIRAALRTAKRVKVF